VTNQIVQPLISASDVPIVALVMCIACWIVAEYRCSENAKLAAFMQVWDHMFPNPEFHWSQLWRLSQNWAFSATHFALKIRCFLSPLSHENIGFAQLTFPMALPDGIFSFNFTATGPSPFNTTSLTHGTFNPNHSTTATLVYTPETVPTPWLVLLFGYLHCLFTPAF